MQKIHELKILPRFWLRVITGQKSFEIRKNDRDYQVGDILMMREFDNEAGQYIDSNTIRAEVIYTTDFAQVNGYIVMGIRVLQDDLILQYEREFGGKK